jgi:hypothetical protein
MQVPARVEAGCLSTILGPYSGPKKNRYSSYLGGSPGPMRLAPPKISDLCRVKAPLYRERLLMPRGLVGR